MGIILTTMDGSTYLGFKGNSLNKPLLTIGASDIISLLVFTSAIIFGCIVIYNIYTLLGIPLHWKIAIASFIFFLPISFFLQVILHEKTMKQLIQTNIEFGLKLAKNAYLNLLQDPNSPTSRTLRDAKLKKNRYDSIDNILMQTVELHSKVVDANKTFHEFCMNQEHKDPVSREEILREFSTANQTIYEGHIKFMEIQNNLKAIVGATFIFDRLDKAVTKKYEPIVGREDIEMDQIFNELSDLERDCLELNKTVDQFLEDINPSDWAFMKIKNIIEFLEKGDETILRIYKYAFGLIESKFYYILKSDMETWTQQTDKRLRLLSELENFNIDKIMNQIIIEELNYFGITLRSFFLPLSFLLFIYFTGFLITLPLVNSVFTGEPQSTVIPLFSERDISGNGKGIPLIVIQFGFLGGFIYTSISLLLRFLRRDIVPRVYFNSAFRLLFSAVASVIVYFLYIITQGNKEPMLSDINPQLLLVCFTIGIAPIQFLIKVADNQLSSLSIGWKRSKTAGSDPVTHIEGINLLVAERLEEENIDCIQQLSLCIPKDLAFKTNYEISAIIDWKDQAILYLLTHDIIIQDKDDNVKVQSQISLYDALNKKMGIRRFSHLNKRIGPIFNNESMDKQKKHFIYGLGFRDNAYDQLDNAFKSILLSGSDYQNLENDGER